MLLFKGKLFFLLGRDDQRSFRFREFGVKQPGELLFPGIQELGQPFDKPFYHHPAGELVLAVLFQRP